MGRIESKIKDDRKKILPGVLARRRRVCSNLLPGHRLCGRGRRWRRTRHHNFRETAAHKKRNNRAQKEKRQVLGRESLLLAFPGSLDPKAARSMSIVAARQSRAQGGKIMNPLFFCG